ncbi:hypothetical protein BH10PSE6_BH10PSE6_09400 [soil metagenome]
MTFLKLLLTLVLTCVAVVPCNAASPTPDEIIAAFFGPSGIADKGAHYTGEMMRLHAIDPTLGEGLKPGVSFASRRLPLSPEETPAFAVTLSDGVVLMDWYAYFASGGEGLKLKAVRTGGPSGLFHDHMVQLAERTARTSDEEWEYQHLRLAFLSDQERIAHFRARIADLDALVALIKSGSADAIHEKMRLLHLRGYERGERGHLAIWIGAGLLTSTSGVLYAPQDLPPPPISEDHYIYIEHIEGPWYVYKTT